jgi:hypothetical protein
VEVVVLVVLMEEQEHLVLMGLQGQQVLLELVGLLV